jgi:hypothetical protein
MTPDEHGRRPRRVADPASSLLSSFERHEAAANEQRAIGRPPEQGRVGGYPALHRFQFVRCLRPPHQHAVDGYGRFTR